MDPTALGFVVAALSAVANGSFAVIFKTKRVASVNLDPILFQFYNTCGVFLSCWLVVPFLYANKEFTQNEAAGIVMTFQPLAMVSGALFVMSTVFSFLAVPLLGVALAQGVWGGAAILVALSWGVLVFGDQVSLVLAIFSLVMLLAGVSGIALCEGLGARLSQGWGHPPLEQEGHLSRKGLLDGEEPYAELGANLSQDSPSLSPVPPTKPKSAYGRGLLCAACVGLCGGSTLAPMHYIGADGSGLVFLPSFGAGAILASPLVCLLWFAYFRYRPPLHLSQTLLPGMLSGFIWNIGNIMSIWAIPRIGFAIALPLLQTALFVAGLWGIVVFREIRAPAAIAVFFFCGALLLVGASMLSMSRVPS